MISSNDWFGIWSCHTTSTTSTNTTFLGSNDLSGSHYHSPIVIIVLYVKLICEIYLLVFILVTVVGGFYVITCYHWYGYLLSNITGYDWYFLLKFLPPTTLLILILSTLSGIKFDA